MRVYTFLVFLLQGASVVCVGSTVDAGSLNKLDHVCGHPGRVSLSQGVHTFPNLSGFDFGSGKSLSQGEMAVLL